MKQWLPYVAAIVIAVAVAVLLFRQPVSTTSSAEGDNVAVAAPTKTTRTVTTSDGPDALPASPGEGATPQPGEPTTPAGYPFVTSVREDREPTPFEQERTARDQRPFNQHYYNVSAFWGQAARYAMQEGKQDLGQACVDMGKYLQSQANLPDGSNDVAKALSDEIALAGKVSGAGLSNPEIAGMMAYVTASARAAQAGQDPTTIPKPTMDELRAGTYDPTTPR